MMKLKGPTLFKCDQFRRRIFKVICLLFGFDPGDSAPFQPPRFCMFAYLLVNGLSFYPTATMLIGIISGQVSLGKITINSEMVASYASMFLTVRIILRERAALVKLLEGDRDLNWVRSVLFILLNVLTIVVYVWLAVLQLRGDGYNEFLTFIFYLHRLLVRNFLILVYVEVLSVLEDQCKFLLSSSKGNHSKPNNLVLQKWMIRDAITTLNRIFAFPLVLAYAQFVMGTIILINQFIAGKVLTLLWFYASSLLCFLAITYLMVCKCTRISDLLVEVERQVLRQLGSYHSLNGMPFSITKSPHTYSSYQWKILCFDEKWDSIRIGCFVHGEQTFASFLATCLTCVAVIMQFDFKVISAVNKLASRYDEGLLTE